MTRPAAGDPKLDIISADCGVEPDGTYFVIVHMGDSITPSLGLFYSWFLQLSAFDGTDALGTATVQEHDSVPDQLFEGVFDATNTTFTTGDDFIIRFTDGVVTAGNTFFLQSGVLQTAGGSICQDIAPDSGFWAFCDDPATIP